jgi:hypothetical protein
VVHYGWSFPIEYTPDATIGILKTDKWLILDRAADRAVISYLRPDSDIDSLWAARAMLRRGSDSLFSVPSAFYASKYFLAEHITGGIPHLRRLLGWARAEENAATVYKVNIEKLRQQIPPPEPSR